MKIIKKKVRGEQKEYVEASYKCPWPGCHNTFKKDLRIKQYEWGKRIHKAVKVNCPHCGRGIPKFSFKEDGKFD